VDFGQAKNLHLQSDADFERYIDARVRGRDRAIVLMLMKDIPADMRSNFTEQFDGTFYSNLYPWMIEARTRRPDIAISSGLFERPDGTVYPQSPNFDFVRERVTPLESTAGEIAAATPVACSGSGCDTGPFVRIVSPLGFGGVRGYMQEPHCGPSGVKLAANEAGFNYFGAISPVGVRYEGGLQINYKGPKLPADDPTVNLYIRASDYTPPHGNKGDEFEVPGSGGLFTCHDPANSNDPDRYVLVLTGLLSDKRGMHYSITAQEYLSTGATHGKSVMFVTASLPTSSQWSDPCAKCAVFRVFSIAQSPKFFTFRNNDVHEMTELFEPPSPPVYPLPIDVRLATGLYVNVREGNLSAGFPKTSYLTGVENDNPVNGKTQPIAEIVNYNYPNAGTGDEGILLKSCTAGHICENGAQDKPFGAAWDAQRGELARLERALP
jgi:hypothetical protein